MDFNDRATGDGAILVAITQVLLALGTGSSLIDLLNPLTLIQLLISGLFFWLLYSGATYAIARFLFDGHGSYAFYLRVTGFAYPTLLVLIFAEFLLGGVDLPILGDAFPLVLILGAAWFVVIVANGITYIADLPLQKAFASAIGGYVVVVILQAILSGLRIF